MSKHLHFQTSFSVMPRGEHPVQALYSKIQRTIFNWTSEKINARGFKAIDFNDFNHRIDKLTHVNGLKLSTSCCLMEDGDAWAMVFIEHDTSDGSRQWETRIGLKADIEGSRVIFSYSTSYLATATEEFEDSVHPEYRCPKIIDLLLEIPDVEVKYDGGVHLSPSYFRIKTFATASSFIAISRDRNRAVPLILIMGANGNNEFYARKLAKELYGKAAVYLADYSPDVINAFRKANHAFVANKFRVYTHGSSKDNDVVPTEVDAVTKVLLKSPIHKAPNAVQSIDDVVSLIRLAKNQRLKDQMADIQSRQITEDDKKYFVLLQETNEELEQENQKLKSERNEIDALHEEELKDYKTKAAAREASLMAEIRRQKETHPFPDAFPNSLEDVMKWGELLPNLVITESAYQSAKKYDQFKDFDIAWDILLKMNEVLFSLKFMENRSDLWTEFEHRTGYEYAKGEGPKTNDNKRLAKLRVFTYNGKTYEAWMHLKHEVQQNKLLRVHFAFDEEYRKILIFHFGDHIENATTRKAK